MSGTDFIDPASLRTTALKSPTSKFSTSKSLKVKNSGITFGRRNMSVGNQSIISYGNDSIDNTSTYDIV
ncbi:MAG: hypothetical protein ACKO96_16165 [Flammeovirgaceae bacterium]